MSALWNVFLPMSLSGALLILILLTGRFFWKNRVSRQWQYYIWLAVVLRLLIPFGPEPGLLGGIRQVIDQAVSQEASFQPAQLPTDEWTGVQTPAASAGEHGESVGLPQDAGTALFNRIWLIWLAVAAGLLIRKITIYQGFLRYVRAGMTPVSDLDHLNQLSIAAEQTGVKRPVELSVNPLISSPLLLGIFHPCIVLPSEDVAANDFRYIVLHELTHCKRWDMAYKWLVQVTVCLHWFNPLVHLMGREITKACEFSCDEAVLAKTGGDHAQDYGKTLLNAMAAIGKYKETLGTATLSGNKQLLKERIDAIMKFQKKSTAVRLLTAALTLCVLTGAVFAGVYPVAAANPSSGKPVAEPPKASTPGKTNTNSKRYACLAERYYASGSLPLFQMTFSYLDEKTQNEWLDRIFADGEIAYMGAVLNLLDDDCPQIQHLAETIYQDGNIAFFSTLTNHMSDEVLETWLDRALDDWNFAFQSVLFNALDWDGEFDELKDKEEKEWYEAQKAEYQAAGVTIDGKNYYYQGKLVRIFLDVRQPDQSFYTLDINQKGVINIRVIRNAQNQITGVAYLTQAEAEELFGEEDIEDLLDEEENPLGNASMEVTIPLNVKTLPAGETVCLGEYPLSEGDRIWYELAAKTGDGMQIFFRKDEERPVYWSVENLRQGSEPLQCTADFTVGPPAKPGTYTMYLRATNGALKNVTGSLSFALSDAF